MLLALPVPVTSRTETSGEPYKIVVWREGEGLNGFAVVMANRSYGSHESFRDEQHLRAIRWLEERLAVDFMPELEPVDADALEARIGRPFR